jgi:amidophosphoribosyltransferase
MSTVDELFAPAFLAGGPLTDDVQKEMAKSLGADSLRYLPVEAIAQAVQFSADQLCQACITGKYPTDWGQQLYQIAASSEGNGGQRTYEGISQMVRSQRA